ncbi:MAG: glycosyltransferase family 2 protein [Bacteroidota bacterium]|nr:glycosyltransferase family 2 protein [Bacteroidota bacterium]
MRPLVSIITINYNQLRLTCDLLESLRMVTYPALEIIVVDNHSEVDPTPEIRARYPEVRLIRSNENLGFAGGNNLGIQASRGEYLMFLNNDTEVDSGFLEPLVGFLQSTPDAGAASPKIIYHNSGETIQYAGSSRIDPITGRSKRIGWMEKDRGQYNTIRETDLAHGAAMMVPRTVVSRVGMMPEFFFLYYEEVDWCESIRKENYKIYYVPGSKVYHKESMSTGKGSTLKTYYMTRNRLLYLRRHSAGLKKITGILFFLFLSIPKNALRFAFSRDTENARALWRGLIWNVTHLDNGQKLKLFA